MKDLLGYKDEYLSTKRGYNLLRLFAPMSCMICGEIDSSEEGPFCKECFEKFSAMLSMSCPICDGKREECECCELTGIKKVFFLFWYYKDVSSDMIKRVKYLGDKREISYLGYLISKAVKNEEFSGICFVPRTKKNIKRTGFDQSKLLAESVAFHLGLPLIECLGRKGRSAEQKKLSGADRRRNVKNKFFVDVEKLKFENGKIPSKILLIDDVVTTGSTVKECSYLLRKSGVKSVFVGAIAKTPTRKTRYKRKPKAK